MRYEFSATFRLVPSSRVMTAESLPTRVPFLPYGKAEFVVLTRAENLIIVSSCKCFWQNFLQRIIFIVKDSGPLYILEPLWANLCLSTPPCTLFFLIKIHNLLTSCALYCVYQLTYPFPVLRVSGSVDTMYKGLSQTVISSQHIKWLRALRSRPLKPVFFIHRFNDILSDASVILKSTIFQ
jgi:hypothetical protein